MSQDQALIHLDLATRKALITTAAEELIEKALASSALIARVESAEENQAATVAQKVIKTALRDIENAREEAKAGPWALCKAIDALGKEMKAELTAEEYRIGKLTGDFQAAELAKLRAQEQLAKDELSKAERDRAEAVAKATSAEQIDAINEEASRKAYAIQQASIAAQPVRADGQIVKTDWEIEIVNKYDLAKYHPQCVNITALLTEIKQLLNEGVQVRGVKAAKKVTSTVRAGKVVDV